MRIDFEGEIFYWRGPSPFHFVAVPPEQSGEIESVAALVTYGWGVIPVTATISATTWTTSLFPKDGLYLVPIRASVRKERGLVLGDRVEITLDLEVVL